MTVRRKFTGEEIVLCIYAARYGEDDLGGFSAIESLCSRSRSSIQMKIRNLVALCDELQVSRETTEVPLSGTASGSTARQTNQMELKKYSVISRADHLAKCKEILTAINSDKNDNSDHLEFREGRQYEISLSRFERDDAARQRCIEHYGLDCVVCGFNFGNVYGDQAASLIHVHHLKPLAEIGTEHLVDPIFDLRPVCPNCHAVIHLGNRTRTIEEVRSMISAASGTA